MKNSIFLLILLLFALLYQGCGDNSTEPTVITKVVISVKSQDNTLNVQNANVVLYDANSGSAITRGSSGADGVCTFDNINSGNFFVKITAQGYNELPPKDITPVPFSVNKGQTLNLTYSLTANPGQWALIKGYVNPKIDGVLIVASDSTGSGYSTYSGPDGYYVIFNLPYNKYTLSAYKLGYQAASDPTVTVTQLSNAATQDIAINAITGSTLSGMVTFLSIANGIVDISLLDSKTHSVINGLTTKINVDRLYTLTNIPNGDYLAWASYKNDGYVMDPDWIYKNPGGLNISFTSSSSKTLNFSVTGAISILSPTNTPDNITPAEVDTLNPLFVWTAYPQAKEYIIEVKDLNGNVLWGGFSSTGVIRHAQISKDVTSIRYNFDGSATAQLKRDQIYQWKIYADNDAAPNVQTLLSSSEDLMGLFVVK